MEHIIQFGVTVDDDAIQKRIMEQASQAITNEIRKELGVTGGYHTENMVRKMVNTEVEKQFEAHKDEIIEATAKALVEKLYRTKQVKDRVESILDDVLGGEQ